MRHESIVEKVAKSNIAEFSIHVGRMMAASLKYRRDDGHTRLGRAVFKLKVFKSRPIQQAEQWRISVSGIKMWRRILGQRGKVAVSVGRKTEMLTRTQVLRLDEISEARHSLPANPGPLDDTRHRIVDAALGLPVPDSETLAAANAGNLPLRTEGASMAARRFRRNIEGNVRQLQLSPGRDRRPPHE